jgi:hypothetical protein
MPDDPTRDLLASLPQIKGLLRKPPSTIAISRSVVADHAEEAGLDLEAVSAWIYTRGGRLVKPPPVQAQTLRAGRRTEQTMPGDAYYVIPATALED